MSVFTALYNLLVGPLELFFEVIFSFANRMFQNPGISIVFLSLVMNFLLLPLYKQADAIQDQERETENKLKRWVTHIKKTFKGDERFMMLQTYYRQNHYKQTDVLKGSISLLLEIPFFIAAYNFLSHLQLLNGCSFGPIQNLGTPDGMLVIAGVSINVLPILMTVVNLISSVIYTKGLPLRSKIQLYGMAALFLILLYQSPAGLVLYWTLNNVFSLVKNLFVKMKIPKVALYGSSSVLGAVLFFAVLFVRPASSLRKQVLLLGVLLLLQLPLILYFIGKKVQIKKPQTISKKEKTIFYLGTVLMALLVGVLIPSAVIHASPEEFINTVTYSSPLLYVLNTALLAVGTFVIWFSIFYKLARPLGKRWMGFAIWALSGTAIINYMFFGKNYGTLSANLQFTTAPVFSVKQQMINLLVMLIAIAVLYLIWKKKQDLIKIVYFAVCIAVVGMSVFNIIQIHTVTSEKIEQLKATDANAVQIPLNKNGKNVIVIMLDRAISGYVPYIFNEKPELQQQFSGFTYYPNTISYGPVTNIAAPSLYGGYEYTPTEMNKRDQESLESKHNEALKVMPVLFRNHGFETTVCDPSYAGYSWIPDLSIYDEYPEINKYITIGRHPDDPQQAAATTDESRYHNFFCYSIFKIVPMAVQPSIYNGGTYNASNTPTEQIFRNASKADGLKSGFMDSYSVLKKLSDFSNITDSTQNTFIMLSNDTAHEPMLLQEPEYEPALHVDNTAYDAEHADRFVLNGKRLHMDNQEQIVHYHANMASLIQLGKWFDYMRENDVYDNTRIIIVSDHGRGLNQFDNMQFGPNACENVMFFNSLLLVKDFNSTEFKTDNQFMTVADVPTIATNGLVENPKNPFTEKPLNNEAKYNQPHRIFFSDVYDVNINNGNTFLPGTWITVHDNIFDMNNWKTEKEAPAS